MQHQPEAWAASTLARECRPPAVSERSQLPLRCSTGTRCCCRAFLLCTRSGAALTAAATPYLFLCWPQEHPLLRRPFFMLHPCQTPAVMALLLEPEARPDEASSRRVCCSGAATESPAAAAAAAAAARAAGRAAATVVAAPGVDGSLPHAHPVPPGAAAAPASGAALRYLLAWLSVAGQPLGVAPPAELWMQRG